MFSLYFLKAVYFRLFLIGKNSGAQRTLSKGYPSLMAMEIRHFIFISHTNLPNICFRILIYTALNLKSSMHAVGKESFGNFIL